MAILKKYKIPVDRAGWAGLGWAGWASCLKDSLCLGISELFTSLLRAQPPPAAQDIAAGAGLPVADSLTLVRDARVRPTKLRPPLISKISKSIFFYALN